MSIIKKISGILNTEISFSGLKESVIGHDKTLNISSKSDDFTKITKHDYIENEVDGVKRHTLEVRYTAHGENSNLICTVLNANPMGNESSGQINALSLSIDLNGKKSSSLVFVLDGQDGLAAEKLFPNAVSELRESESGRIGEIGNFQYNRNNKARRAFGAMFHIVLLYARQIRQVRKLILVANQSSEYNLNKWLGFEKIAARYDQVLMVLDVDVMRREQRQWGGKKDDSVGCSFSFYPYFFPSKDEPGLMVRILEHLVRKDVN